MLTGGKCRCRVNGRQLQRDAVERPLELDVHVVLFGHGALEDGTLTLGHTYVHRRLDDLRFALDLQEHLGADRAQQITRLTLVPAKTFGADTVYDQVATADEVAVGHWIEGEAVTHVIAATGCLWSEMVYHVKNG